MILLRFPISFILLLVTQIYMALSFLSSAKGFATDDGGSVFYCRELMSSGSDDEFIMVVMLLQLIPITVRLARLKQSAENWEMYLFCCTSILSLALILYGLECGSYFFTAFVLREFVLLAILLIYPLAFVTLWMCRKRSSRHC